MVAKIFLIFTGSQVRYLNVYNEKVLLLQREKNL